MSLSTIEEKSPIEEVSVEAAHVEYTSKVMSYVILGGFFIVPLIIYKSSKIDVSP
jgi:hypothetical protein